MLNESKNEKKKKIQFYIKRMVKKHNISMFISIVSDDDVLHICRCLMLNIYKRKGSQAKDAVVNKQ